MSIIPEKGFTTGLQLSNLLRIIRTGYAGRAVQACNFFIFVDNETLVIGISLRIRFLLGFIQERRMKKALAILVASVFLAGSALAVEPAGKGATASAAGEITPAMVAAGVAVVAIAVAIAASNDDNNTTTTTTTTTQ